MSDKGRKAQVSEHFGRSPNFTMYDSETGEIETVENYSEHMGGSKKPPQIMKEHGVDVMVCSNLGRRAVSMFERLGIEVYTGAFGNVGEVIEKWKNNELEKASKDEACEGEH